MQKTIGIDGMMCQHCVQHVTKALESIPGVSSVQVQLAEKRATLTAEPSVSDDALREAVTQAGYEVTAISTD